MTTKCNLRKCFLCSNCLEEWHQLIALNKINREVKKGHQIFTEGEAASGIYFVYQGKVKVHKKWDSERELITRFANEGDILGHLGLGNANIYPVSATAIEKVTVCYMGSDFFETTLKVNPQFTYQLMRFFADELQEREKRMSDLIHMSVKARIVQSFINLKRQFGMDNEGFINIELSRQDISSYAGVVYETLFKTLTELIGQQVITVTGKRFKIIDEQFLLQIIKDDQQKQSLKERK